MKLNTNTNTIERIGNVTEEAQFRMKTSQKAFQILSDLYSDKPLAIVRELGCNAADSMTAAAKANQPFHIHLPNSLEPWLTIQDFGTGISHNDIYDIYTVYFASTKTNSNSQIGCLGLGSKSPFCYTDNFSVTSIVNGEKRIYNAYFNESGTPAIALMSVDITNEKNGVAIQIPVKSGDFNDFIEAVKKAFRFFDVKPTITGGKIEWDASNPMFQADDWAFYDRMADRYHGESFAIMGGVTYPIDPYKVDDDGNNEYRQMLRNGLVLKFAMGELDFTPARDALSYTPMTIKAINNKLLKVTKELPIKIIEMIDTKDTLIEAIRATMFFTEKFFFLNANRFGASNKQDVKVTWKGIDISNPLAFFKKLAPEMEVFSKRAYHRRKISVSVQPQFGSDVEWFYDNLNKGGERRVRAYVSDSCKTVMLFKKTDYDNLIANNFTTDMFKETSSLPSPTVQRKVRSNGTVVQKAKEDITIYVLSDYHKEKWESEVIEPSEDLPKYYFVKSTDGWNPKLKLKGINELTCKQDITNVLNAFDLKSKDICMVSAREEKKIIQRGGCQSLETWWAKNVDVTSVDADAIHTVVELAGYGLSRLTDMTKRKKFKELTDDNNIKKAIMTMIELIKVYSKYTNVHYSLEHTKKSKMKDFGLTDAQQIIFKRLCDSYHDTDEWFVIADALKNK
jgi:hypothetical protein